MAETKRFAETGHARSDTGNKPPAVKKIALKAMATLVALVALAATGMVLVFDFVGGERERVLHQWQAKLAIVAESRAAAVGDWLDRHFRQIGGLADNTALRLYVSQLLKPDSDGAGAKAEPAEREYLRNLLIVTADRSGFNPEVSGPRVRANVKRVGNAGLAILDLEGRVLVATRSFPPFTRELKAFLKTLPRGERALYDLHRGPDGKPAIGFVAPIYRVQGSKRAADQIGIVLALKPVAAELYRLLRQPGVVDKTAEALLARPSGRAVEYLSPRRDRALPLTRKLALDTPKLAAARAIARPGGFEVGRDYAGTRILMTSREIDGAPWTLIYKIDHAEALGPGEARLQRLLAIMLLAILLSLTLSLAVWRHGASRRASEAAQGLQRAASQLERQRNLLRALTDNQPNAMYVVDDADTFRFANRQAAEQVGLSKDDMIGKSLASVVGTENARRYERLNREALEKASPVAALHRLNGNQPPQVLQSKHVPLDDAVLAPNSVLVVEEDVTVAITERERRWRNLRQLVDTLVTVVDSRDRYAAHHSSRAATVCQAVAEEMGLDTVTVETATFAGNLMNLGKIMVPEQILTKPGKLTKKELQQVRDSIQAGADLLEGIEFDGPVVETLRQVQERWDGSGRPNGLRGEQILLPARIVAVSNAFVAMVSPRAQRDGLDFDDAVAALHKDAGSAYDGAVISALANYLDNRGGRRAWQRFGEQPAADQAGDGTAPPPPKAGPKPASKPARRGAP